ncbi:MAG: NAD-dependent epimerase/dehydratase family protein [Desulfobacterales bacterium]|nr:NAD-dependent epimerase/dehydratase family protein [Desulfobacterales bacterium]
MKALVTGGGGFLGRFIVRQLLARGDDVAIFSRGDYPELRKIGVRLISGDLGEPEPVRSACAGIHTVFHAAANTGMWGPWEAFNGPNVRGTQHVLDACLARGVDKLVYTSSPSVVFANASQENCDESLPYPASYESHYAKSKAMGEKLVLEANGNRLLTCSLRPHLVFGPGDPHLLVAVLARARTGRFIQVGDGKNKVDFSYVEDAARAHILAADALGHGSAVAGSAYFISQDEPVALYPWLRALFARLDIPPLKRRCSLRSARAIGAVLECVHRTFPRLGEPRITRFLASELALSHYYDISRAKNDFGYRPLFTMEQALEKTLPYLADL